MSLHTSCYTFKPRSKKSLKATKLGEKTIYLPWPFPVQIDKITKKQYMSPVSQVFHTVVTVSIGP